MGFPVSPRSGVKFSILIVKFQLFESCELCFVIRKCFFNSLSCIFTTVIFPLLAIISVNLIFQIQLNVKNKTKKSAADNYYLLRFPLFSPCKHSRKKLSLKIRWWNSLIGSSKFKIGRYFFKNLLLRVLPNSH